MIRWSVLLVLCALAGMAGVSAAPHASPFGVNGAGFSHLGANTPDFDWDAGIRRLDALQAMGAAWDRGDWWWDRIEPEKGRFVWTDYDRIADEYNRRGIHLLPILCYDAAWRKDQSPNTDAYREEYGRFVYETVRHFKGRITAYEIWNEPNISIYWHGTPPSAEDYAKLLKVAYREAKRADPDVTIVGGVVAGMDFGFIEGMLKNGAGDAMDAISVHPYQGNLGSVGPEEGGLARDLRALQNLLARHGHAGMPVWITEMGNRTVPDPDIREGHPQPAGRVTEQQQANYLVRSYALALSEGVRRVFWFNLVDWTNETWGTMSAHMRKKPSWYAYRAMSRVLTGKEYAGTLSAWPDVYMPWFRSPSADGSATRFAVAAWTGNAGESVGLRQLFPSDRLLASDGSGVVTRAALLRPAGKEAAVALNGEPLYLVSEGAAGAADTPGSVTTLPAGVSAQPDTVAPGDTFRLVFGATDTAVADSLKHLPRALVFTSADSHASRKSDVASLGNDSWRLKDSVAPGDYNVGYVWVSGKGRDARIYTATARLHVKPAISVSIVPEPSRGRSLTLSVTNGSARPVTTEARVDIIGARTDTISSIALDPRQTRTFPLNRVASADAPLATPLPVSVTASPGDAAWEGNVYFWSAGRDTPGAPLTLDSAQQWLSQDGTWSGPDDLSAAITARYNNDRLLLRAEVTDDVFSQEFSDGEVWRGDSLQMAVDPGWTRRPDASGSVEFGLALTPDGPRVYRWTPPAGPMPGATLSVQRQGTTTVYEASLPWKELGVSAIAPPRTIGLSLIVNDNDGQGREGWLAYGGGIAREKRADRYATLTLLK